MGVDQTSLDRIRNATFPASRRGYDKQEVEKFLSRLADWLETGGGDENRSETVKRELERVGERTGAILAQAEESAQQIRGEAEQEARETIANANAEAEQSRKEADAYDKETRKEADGYADEGRKTVKQEAAESRAQLEQEVRETIADAQAQAGRIVDEGTQRREDIEAVIADLARRRDMVLADIQELSGKLNDAITEHRPPEGEDPFEKPDDLDPGGRTESQVEEDHPEEVEPEDVEPELIDAEEPEEAEAEKATSKQKSAAKGSRRRRSRGKARSSS